MDQNVKDGDCFESGVNVDIHLLRNTNNVGEKSSECDQCEYASPLKRSLKIILKYTTEKSYGTMPALIKAL